MAVLVLSSQSIWQALLVGLAYGAGLNTVGHGWVFHSLLGPVHAGWVLSLAGTFIFVLYLTLFIALPAAVFRWCSDHMPHFWRPWLFASCMTAGEFCRSVIYNGYSGLSLGYSLVDEVPKHWLSLVGVYGLGWLAYLVSAGIATVWLNLCQSTSTARSIFFALVYALVLYGGGWALQQVQWVTPAGAPLKFRLLQFHVKQEEKFRADLKEKQLESHLAWIRKEPADLILTPETAFPIPFHQISAQDLQAIRQFSQEKKTHVFLGMTAYSGDNNGFNSLFHLNPQGQLARYDKVQLMPLGEYAPIGLGWFSHHINIAQQDLTPGKSVQAPFELNSSDGAHRYQAGTMICREELAGQQLHRWLPQVNLLLNPSNLSWFDGSAALPQMLQIVQARALEAGRPVLRAANTGISAHIDHLGTVHGRLDAGRQGAITGLVQPMTGQTGYARWGDLPAVVFSVLLVSLGVLLRLRSPR